MQTWHARSRVASALYDTMVANQCNMQNCNPYGAIITTCSIRRDIKFTKWVTKFLHMFYDMEIA
jgi:hypothetical protein